MEIEQSENPEPKEPKSERVDEEETEPEPSKSLEEDIVKTDKGTDPREVDADPAQETSDNTDMEEARQKSKVHESPRGSLRRKGSGLSRNLSRSTIKTNGNVEAGTSKFIEGVESPIIKVSKNGFSEPEIVIMEGMEVTFEFLEKIKPEVVQVIHDGDKLRPVIGGLNSKLAETFDEEGNYVQKFTLEGEYKFAIQSVRCTPLNVIVKRRMPLQAAIVDEKFDPQIIEIDQGHAINWSWNFTEVPHSVQEVQYVMDKGCFMKVADEDSSNVVRTVTGNFQKKFPKPGLFFFQTESTELDKVHLCAVRVNECKREYKVEILDRSFNPPVVLVETGDRVWWYWDKFKCKKPHSVYQIEAPRLNQDDEEPYVPVTDGFRWTAPSKQGLLSHIFTKPGVYYYSDQNFEEAAEYIGTIIVKPKPKEYFVDLTQDGFQTELLRVNTGERIWFCWDPKVCAEKKQQFHIIESEKCQNPVAKTNDSPRDNKRLQFLDDEALSLCTQIGYCSVFYNTVGVYHYRVANGPDNLNTCSVIVNPGEKNHTIHLTDNGPEQKVIMSVRPNDRVWWVWQTTKKAHNVIQVSHQGEPIEGGFCSGMPRDAPSAFVHAFSSPGVFYYKSQRLPKLFGAVVVTTQPRVHEVKVGLSIDPDPVEVKLNDIVCWVFSSNKTEDVAEMETADQVTANEIQCKKILKRRCLNRAITSTGVRHYYSTSFSKQKKTESNFIEDVRFSSVICDERYDNTVVRVDKEGFHPHFVYIEKGESVRWTWLGTDQEHNIIHVSSPESKEPLNVIHGTRSFNSGKMVRNNSFLYTFDEKGAYTVASQGAPGYSCTIFVISGGAQRVLPPYIPTSSVNGGTVDRYAEVALNCETEESKIFYTTDGSPPELHMDSAKLYKDDKKVKLKEAGLCFLRAMAVQEGKLNSPIFTSRRFWVLPKDSEKDAESDSSSVQGTDRREQKQVQNTDNWDWWSCVPTIKACFTDPGVMEVFWEEPNANQKKLIKGYQIYLNGVSYCDIFPSTDTSLNISGLAGNHVYEVYVEVYSVDPAQNPQGSNKLMMKCPIMSTEGGPVISLERSDKRDALVVVWMSIDTREYPIKGYLVYLNEQQCGAMLVPDPDKNRCKVFIGGCELNKPYKIYVVALPEDKEEDPRISNVIEVVLPLDVSQIELPSEEERISEEELYLEFLSIQQGSGYLPAMDDHPKDFSPVHKSRRQFETTNTRKELMYKEKRGTSSHPAIVEVEDPRHRAGVTPLKKAGIFKSQSFSKSEDQHSDSRPLSRQSKPLTDEITGIQESSVLSQKPPVHNRKHWNAVVLAEQITRRGRAEQKVHNEMDQSQSHIYRLSNQNYQRSHAESVHSGTHDYDRQQMGNRSEVRSQKSFMSRPGIPQGQGIYSDIDPSVNRSPTPEESRKNSSVKVRGNSTQKQGSQPISFQMAGRLAKFKAPQINVSIQRHKNPLTFKLVATAVKSYLSQERALMWGMAPGRFQKKFLFDWTRFRKWINLTKAFDKKKKEQLVYSLKAPASPPNVKDDRTELFIQQQIPHARMRQYQSNVIQQQADPDLYPENYQDYRQRDPYAGGYGHSRSYENLTPRGSRPPRYGQYLGVDHPMDIHYQSRSFDGVSPERIKRSPRFEFRAGLEEDLQRERSRSYERREQNRPPQPRLRSREVDPSRRYYDMIDSHDPRYGHNDQDIEQHSRDHGFYDESGSDGDFCDYHEEYDEEDGYYDVPDSYMERRGRQTHVNHRGMRDYGGVSQRDRRYDRFLDSSPEERGRSFRDRRGFDMDFGIYQGRKSQQPLTMKEFNEKRQREERKSRRQKRHKKAPTSALKTLSTYGKMFKGELLQDIVAVEDQSVMTDDNYEKSTQTHGKKGHIKNLRDSYGSDDFVPPSMSDRKRAGQGRRRSMSGSESESESRSESDSSSGSESDSESDAGRLSNDGSVVVVSMKKQGEPSVQQQTRSRGTSPSPREPLTRSRGSSPREPMSRSVGSSPREPPSSSRVRSAGGRGYVPLEKSTALSAGEYTPKPPSGRKIRDDRSGRYSRVAVIEVQESIDFDGRRPSSGVKVTGDETGRRLVQEGEAVYNDDNDKEKIGLPAPVISVESKSRSSVEVEWTIGKVDHNYELIVYIVNIVGKRFSREINSHTSFDTNLFENGRETRGVQHCWNMERNRKRMAIKGLLPGLTYRIFVIASYTFLQDEQPCEIQTRSSVIYYTTIGPPRSPEIKVVSIGYYQVTVEWEPPHMDKNLELHGYEVYVDKKLLRRLLTKETRQMIINDLEPGKTISVYVVAVTRQNGMKSEPSREVHITCPRRPPKPYISQQPSFKNGCVLVAWNKPDGVHAAVRQEGISRYAIFLNGKYYGDIRSSTASDRRGYQYVLTGLNPEESYDVNIRSIAGHKPVDAYENHVFCMSDSELSNTLPVCAPAAPKSPELRLESMTPKGIRVTWVQPQQYGDADISGYQLLKNGKIYGAIMGPEANSVDIKDVTLGDKVVLQLIALTNHPVGKLENVVLDTDEQTGGSPRDDRAEKDSATSQKFIKYSTREGIKTKKWPTIDNLNDVFLGEKYAGCRPGPKLTVHFTGLVMAPSQVWCEQVTGHSALVVWSKEYNLPEVPSLGLIHEEDALQVPVPDESLRTHFVRPDHYIVTWWRGDQPEDDIISEETKDDHLLLTGLRPATTYTIIVEARRMETYKMEDGEEGSVTNKFIMTAKSEQLTVHSARPPDPPSNLCFTAMTCHSLRVEWDPPIEHGVEVIGIRIDAQSMNTRSPHHVAFEVRPDERHADIEPLQEKTDYIVRVTAITDEYFDRLPDRHKLKKLRALPRERMVDSNDSPWLPNAYIMTKTAGTEPPANVKVIKASTSTLTISWVAPIVYGSNRLTGIVVRWSDVKNVGKNDNKELFVASHVNLDPSENTVTIEDLIPGAQYKIIVEAVVSIKTSLDPDDKDMDRYRRTAHIMSKPLYARARAPTEPPKLYVAGYTQTTAQLYWEKPSLVSVIGKDAEGKPKYLRRYLEGYKLEINDRLHSCLGPNAQSCQLTKCKPGKKYRVVLVALTCTDQGKKERKKKYKGVYRNTMPQDIDYSALLQDEENLDPSPSEEVQVILPTNQEGYIKSLDRKFIHEEDRDGTTFGDVEVSWKPQGETVNRVRQFNIIWSNGEDRQVQTKVVSADINRTLISVTRMKAVYDIQVEPDYFTDTLQQWNQKIQIVIPGPPDAPQIFLKSVSPEEFVIEWGEPRLFGGVKIRGYQVYLNDKKVGNELSNSHRKAVIPCRPNKNYKVQLVALSDNPRYSDSSKSNTLNINTATHSQQQLGEDDFSAADGLDIPVKVTQVTESSIHMDWSTFIETDGVEGYKIQWSSVAQPAQREVKLSQKDSSCVINNCLPGTTHFVRLVALDKDNQILEKSKQMTIQTSAPPDSPSLSVRACNFRYIAVQWDKPSTYGDALVTGYKVYVNGIVEAILNADQLSFTFTHGKWCEEYAFQVQALTSFEKLNSKVSEPLVIVWPGCRAPHLRRLPTHSSSCIRVAWDDPYLTEGVKVKHFRACCMESDTEKLVTPAVGPIHPDTREAEFKNLKRGTYSIYLEIHLYGTGDVIQSEPIHVTPAPAPAPPKVTVTVVGLEERRALDKLTCDLVNKRDRLIRKVGHKLKEIGALSHPLRAEKNKAVIEGAHTLSRIEEILENCFAALEHYTGQLIAHVSWSCPQSSSDTQISGFKVLIDGKQYGSPVHEGIKTVKIKLGTDQPIYKLSMITLSDKPQASSEESNTVDLLSQNFRPFCFYCYHSIHIRNARWPSQGCCKYQDSVMYERQLAKKLANQGLLKRKVPPPACSLLDIFQGEYKPILASHNKQFPTVILFWTPWCLSSQKVMSFYAKFAKEASSEFNFIAVSCGVNATQASDRKALIHEITANGWREDRVIWHCTSQCASSIYEATNHIWKNTNIGSHKREEADPENGKYMDLTEILGIAGVPTFLFIHSDGYIAWHGRYSAYDYASFSGFMRCTASEVMGTQCPVFNCDICKNDMTIDEESLEPVLQLVRDAPTQSITLSLPQDDHSPSPTRMDSPHNTSDQSADRLFKKRQTSPKMKKKKLTVNQRPYSASTYVQLLKSPYMQKTVPSPKVLNKLMRPQSGGARLG